MLLLYETNLFFFLSKRESDKRPIIHGNPVAQQFIQLVYNHFKVSHEDQNPITETAKVLKLRETTVYKYKDGSVESEITPVTRKRKKLQTTDSSGSVKQTIRLEIYKCIHFV
ncbi:unnamed protein product [Ceutorhynchus assimilis]|uniref:Uncharacterized protein n=1 Tax=Ceutorhynchus assimilis TaxID=467358 RepID=A0A9N9QEF4_9CUCU|nr:unnamed protein product [Ceutorhynchus assimilis]